MNNGHNFHFTDEDVQSPHDWPEDSSDENGNYLCDCIHCGTQFTGYKRRVCCKVCASQADDEIERQDDIRATRQWQIRMAWTGLAILAAIVIGLCFVANVRGAEPRPFHAIMYSPPWCGVCKRNDRDIRAANDPRFVYQHIEGDESKFPASVRRRAAFYGWPVWWVERDSNDGWFENGYKTVDEICKLHEKQD